MATKNTNTQNTQSIHRDGAEYRSDTNEVRGSRGVENRANERMELSDDERLAILRRENSANILPTVPSNGEWHYCWLTTHNPQDHIGMRQRIGYQLVKWADLPEMGHMNVEGASEDSTIQVREMKLARIRKSLYQKIMHMNHGTEPSKQLAQMTTAAELDATLRASQSARGLNLTHANRHVTSAAVNALIRGDEVPSGFDRMMDEKARAQQFNEFPD